VIDPELAAHQSQTDRLEALTNFLGTPLCLPEAPERKTLMVIEETMVACLRAIQKIVGGGPPNVTSWTDDFGGDSCGRVDRD
jgi:hypothetical protein